MFERDEGKLTRKPVGETSEIMWITMEELLKENCVQVPEHPTEEESAHMTMVLVHFCSFIFGKVLSATTGNLREEIAKSWIQNIDAALKVYRYYEIHGKAPDHIPTSEETGGERDA